MRTLTLLVGLFLLPLLLMGAPRPASQVAAGTAIRMDVPDLVERADLIVEARITAERSYQVEDFVETEYLLEVDRTFTGEDQPLRSVRLPGGTLEDGSGMLLAGLPRLQVGEDVILFLSPEGEAGLRMPVGLAQGKLRVVRDGEGRKALLRDVTGMHVVERPDGSGRVVGEGGLMVQAYADVVAEIEATLAARRDR